MGPDTLKYILINVTMSTYIKYSIAKLNGNNYFNWRYKIIMLLIEKEIWCIIENPIPEVRTYKRMAQK